MSGLPGKGFLTFSIGISNVSAQRTECKSLSSLNVLIHSGSFEYSAIILNSNNQFSFGWTLP